MDIHRVVVKLQVNDDRLYNPFEAGEIILNDMEFQWLKTNYPNSFVEIPMNEQEWLQYLSNEVHKSYEKAVKLQMICEQFGLDVKLPVAFEPRTGSIASAALKGRMLNPDVYGGGFNDVIEKARTYKNDVESYEKAVFAKLNANSKTK